MGEIVFKFYAQFFTETGLEWHNLVTDGCMKKQHHYQLVVSVE